MKQMQRWHKSLLQFIIKRANTADMSYASSLKTRPKQLQHVTTAATNQIPIASLKVVQLPVCRIPSVRWQTPHSCFHGLHPFPTVLDIYQSVALSVSIQQRCNHISTGNIISPCIFAHPRREAMQRNLRH